jgi:thiamine-phosphate pyrophosphorylase
MRLHAIVTDIETARAAVEGGATVVQLRLKGATTEEVVEAGRPFRDLPALFIVNDDVEAAVALDADGVHLGREDVGAECAVEAGLLLGISATSVDEARAGQEAGAAYIGAGPVRATPSKPDAGRQIGLEGLAAICLVVSIPVVAIGGVDATNARACLAAGAAGVAVLRAASDAKAVSEALGAR